MLEHKKYQRLFQCSSNSPPLVKTATWCFVVQLFYQSSPNWTVSLMRKRGHGRLFSISHQYSHRPNLDLDNRVKSYGLSGMTKTIIVDKGVATGWLGKMINRRARNNSAEYGFACGGLDLIPRNCDPLRTIVSDSWIMSREAATKHCWVWLQNNSSAKRLTEF